MIKINRKDEFDFWYGHSNKHYIILQHFTVLYNTFFYNTFTTNTTCCNTLQQFTTLYNTLQHLARLHITLQSFTTPYNTSQYLAILGNTLSMHCNTLVDFTILFLQHFHNTLQGLTRLYTTLPNCTQL